MESKCIIHDFSYLDETLVKSWQARQIYSVVHRGNELIRNRIYRIVRRIPPGSVLSYGDVARLARTGPRQVAAVMKACPAGLPWHRVVGAGGKILTRGETGWSQRERLAAEGIRFRGSGFSYRLYKWRSGSHD